MCTLQKQLLSEKTWVASVCIFQLKFIKFLNTWIIIRLLLFKRSWGIFVLFFSAWRFLYWGEDPACAQFFPENYLPGTPLHTPDTPDTSSQAMEMEISDWEWSGVTDMGDMVRLSLFSLWRNSTVEYGKHQKFALKYALSKQIGILHAQAFLRTDLLLLFAPRISWFSFDSCIYQEPGLNVHVLFQRHSIDFTWHMFIYSKPICLERSSKLIHRCVALRLICYCNVQKSCNNF